MCCCQVLHAGGGGQTRYVVRMRGGQIICIQGQAKWPGVCFPLFYANIKYR